MFRFVKSLESKYFPSDKSMDKVNNKEVSLQEISSKVTFELLKSGQYAELSSLLLTFTQIRSLFSSLI